MIGILFLVFYTIVMVSATILLSKKNSSSDNFYVGNRNMGTVAAAMSIAATWIWAPALFTSAEKAYSNGIAGLFWFVVPNILCLLIFIPFAKKIRREMPEGITLSGFMYSKYESKSVRNVYLFQLGTLNVLSTAVQLLAGGKVMSMVTGIPFWIMTIILAVIALSYSVISGIQASVITDDLQMGLILLACVLFVPLALQGNGTADLVKGIGGFTGEFASIFSGKGAEVFFAFGLPTAIGLIAGPFGDQCFWQRAFSIKENKIGKAYALGAILFAIAPLSMGVLGFIAAGSGFVPESTGYVNFEFITHIFGNWAVLPFLFMLVSGLLSTVDSNFCSFSSLTTDLAVVGSDLSNDTSHKKRDILSMVLVAVLGIMIANIPGMTVTGLFLFYGTLRASTLLTTIMTLKGLDVTALGVTVGVLVSLFCGLPIFAYGNIYGIALYKTIGCLTTALSSGIVALIITKFQRRKASC